MADALSRRPYQDEEISTHKINALDSQPITPVTDMEDEVHLNDIHVKQQQEDEEIEEERYPLQVHFGDTDDPKEINLVVTNDTD